MADLSIPFHALPSEVLRFVDQIVSEMNLYVIATFFPPWRVRVVDRSEIFQAVMERSCHRIAFSDKVPLLPARTQGEFVENNPGLLYLDIGREDSNGLVQSWLASRTLSSSVNPKWKDIAARLRAITEAGAIAINPATGATSRVRNHRFTSGAKALSDRGIPILPYAGICVYKLGQISADSGGSK